MALPASCSPPSRRSRSRRCERLPRSHPACRLPRRRPLCPPRRRARGRPRRRRAPPSACARTASGALSGERSRSRRLRLLGCPARSPASRRCSSSSRMRLSRVGTSKIPPERLEPLLQIGGAFFQLGQLDVHDCRFHSTGRRESRPTPRPRRRVPRSRAPIRAPPACRQRRPGGWIGTGTREIRIPDSEAEDTLTWDLGFGTRDSPAASRPPAALQGEHAPRLGGRAFVVVAEQVQEAVGEQGAHLVDDARRRVRAAWRAAVSSGDDDVAEQRRLAGCWLALSRPKGEHVRRLVLVPVRARSGACISASPTSATLSSASMSSSRSRCAASRRTWATRTPRAPSPRGDRHAHRSSEI